MIVKNSKEFHRAVCERDEYICQVCKKYYGYECYFKDGVNQMVCGHHLKRRNSAPELILETDNGICVCNNPSKKHPEGCHNAIHDGNFIP